MDEQQKWMDFQYHDNNGLNYTFVLIKVTKRTLPNTNRKIITNIFSSLKGLKCP